jgi:hypothetical protein
MLVAGWEIGKVATAHKLILGKEEQGTDLPPVSEELGCCAACLVAEVPQQAGIGRAVPWAWRRGSYQEAGTIERVAPVDLEPANDCSRHWASGESCNAVMLLDREDGWHRSLEALGGDVSRSDLLLPLI